MAKSWIKEARRLFGHVAAEQIRFEPGFACVAVARHVARASLPVWFAALAGGPRSGPFNLEDAITEQLDLDQASGSGGWTGDTGDKA